jgi:hypothetical protein
LEYADRRIFFEMPSRLAAARYDGPLDVLLEAEAVDGPAAFPAGILDSLRRALRCDAASYREWTAAPATSRLHLLTPR